MVDSGVQQISINDRILAKQVKADFRKVESASLKLTTHFCSPEAKRAFVRFFATLQLNAYFVSVIARTKLQHEDVERVEAALRKRIEATADDINEAIDGAEALFKNNGISQFATYDTPPLAIEVGVISSHGRRYLEVLNKLDQVMPLLQTLEIHEVITLRDADIQRARLKRGVRAIAGTARNLASGLRRRMNNSGERSTGLTVDVRAGSAASESGDRADSSEISRSVESGTKESAQVDRATEQEAIQ